MKNSWKCMLLCVAMVLAFAACSNNGEGTEALPDDGAQEPKEYVVSLGMAGEILEIEESPLSKAEGSNDLYGVQVYSKTATTEYTPYAYGLFDNTADMTIRLLAGYEYKFVATMVVDGKEKISFNSYDNSYGAPFENIPFNDTSKWYSTYFCQFFFSNRKTGKGHCFESHPAGNPAYTFRYNIFCDLGFKSNSICLPLCRFFGFLSYILHDITGIQENEIKADAEYILHQCLKSYNLNLPAKVCKSPTDFSVSFESSEPRRLIRRPPADRAFLRRDLPL